MSTYDYFAPPENRQQRGSPASRPRGLRRSAPEPAARRSTLSAQQPGMTCLEICAGAGGQALGLEQAGISHASTVEVDHDACETLRLNRQHAWKVIEAGVRHFDGRVASAALGLVQGVVGGEKVIEGAAGHSGTATPMETVTRMAEVPSWGTASREIPWWMRSAILRAWAAVVRGAAGRIPRRRTALPGPGRIRPLLTVHESSRSRVRVWDFLTKKRKVQRVSLRARNMARECGNCDRPRRQGLKGEDDGSPQHYVDISST